MQTTRSSKDAKPASYDYTSARLRSFTPSSSRPHTQRRGSNKPEGLPEPVRSTQDVNYFSKHRFASNPWISGPGIDVSEYSITLTKDFFSYSAKTIANTFSGAMVSVRAVHRAKCECEFVDGSRIECERLTCEFSWVH